MPPHPWPSLFSPGRSRSHEWTREAKEPRMDTNGHEKKLRNHEWTRMDTNGYGQGRGGTTNGHGKPRNHEWTRMDTNDKDRRNHETHETHEKNSGTTNGHEWIPRRRQGRYRKTPRLLCPRPNPLAIQVNLQKAAVQVEGLVRRFPRTMTTFGTPIQEMREAMFAPFAKGASVFAAFDDVMRRVGSVTAVLRQGFNIPASAD